MSQEAPIEGLLDFTIEPGCHETVQSELLEAAEMAGLAACDAHDLRLVVEEVLTNVVKYSGADASGDKGRVRWRMWADQLVLEFENPGRPFDPLSQSGKNRSEEDRCEGGMGILLIESIADSIDYFRENGRNRLRLTFTDP